MVKIIAAMTDYTEEEIKTWSIGNISTIANDILSISDFNSEFHAILEYNGKLYGYATIEKASFGEFIDMENLCKDPAKNLDQIAALLYRPISKHRFDSLSFMVKQKIKMVNNAVENVFDWYEVDEYNNQERKDRAKEFSGFPVHIILGAMAFFLGTAQQYLTDTTSSNGDLKMIEMKAMSQLMVESLLENIGAGGGLSTTSLSPIYYQYQESKPSLT